MRNTLEVQYPSLDALLRPKFRRELRHTKSINPLHFSVPRVTSKPTLRRRPLHNVQHKHTSTDVHPKGRHGDPSLVASPIGAFFGPACLPRSIPYAVLAVVVQCTFLLQSD